MAPQASEAPLRYQALIGGAECGGFALALFRPDRSCCLCAREDVQPNVERFGAGCAETGVDDKIEAGFGDASPRCEVVDPDERNPWLALLRFGRCGKATFADDRSKSSRLGPGRRGARLGLPDRAVGGEHLHREVFDAADVRIVEQEGCQGRVAPRKQGEREEARLAEISEADEPKRLRQPPDFGIGVAGVAPYVHLLRPFACQHIVENRLAEELSDRQAACRDPCQDIRGRGRMQARAWIDFGDPARTGGVKIRVDVGVAGAYP